MALIYDHFDPSPCGFPQPRVPILPKLDLAEMQPFQSGADKSVSCPSGFAGRTRYFYTRGRYALFEAYRLAGVGPQGALLAPSYHCRTMLDPAISLGGEVRLYPLKPDLSPDLDALASLIETAGRPVKALLLTHYFGFPLAVQPVAALCARHGIRLIEDCSHAYAGMADGQCIGSIGDYAVASPYKYFPCEDGGILVANRGASSPVSRPRRAALREELRSVVRSLLVVRDRSRQQVGAADVPLLEGQLRALRARSLPPAVETEKAQDGFSNLYSADEEGRAGLAASRLIMRCSDTALIAGQRRANYRTWAAGVSSLPNCRVPFAELPEACVPYMFPLYIERPLSDFYLLKHLGVPIWRWDEMARSSCSVAADYRLHLIHLPCHQNLRRDELDWMIAAVSVVLRSSAEMAR